MTRKRRVAMAMAAALTLSACAGPVTYGEDGPVWQPEMNVTASSITGDSFRGGYLLPALLLAIVAAAAVAASD